MLLLLFVVVAGKGTSKWKPNKQKAKEGTRNISQGKQKRMLEQGQDTVEDNEHIRHGEQR